MYFFRVMFAEYLDVMTLLAQHDKTWLLTGFGDSNADTDWFRDMLGISEDDWLRIDQSLLHAYADAYKYMCFKVDRHEVKFRRDAVVRRLLRRKDQVSLDSSA